jgi:hypothetical protein
MSDDLKPCPSCGAENIEIHGWVRREKLDKAAAYLQKISRHANRSCSAIAARALADLEGK